MKKNKITKEVIFLVAIILFALFFVSAYKTGEIAEKETKFNEPCIGPYSVPSSWDRPGCSAADDYWMLDCNSQTQIGAKFMQKRILNECPCICGETQECARLQYLFESSTLKIWSVLERCKECYQDIEKHQFSGPFEIRRDILVAKNRCSKKSSCGDPCGGTCPEMKCVIADKNADGDTTDAGDFNCVQLEPGDVTNYEQCGKKCCRNEMECCGNEMCCTKKNPCTPVEGALGFSKKLCVDKECNTTTHKLCSKVGNVNLNKPVCCKKEETCSVIMVAGAAVGTCSPKTDCAKPCGDAEPPVCCNENQECNKVGGVPFCQAKDESSCPPERPKICKGKNPKPGKEGVEVKICCAADAICEEHPNGAPYCGPPLS